MIMSIKKNKQDAEKVKLRDRNITMNDIGDIKSP